MKHLTLDFETVDSGMQLYGSGWVFKLHYPEYMFDVLGVGYRTHDGQEGYISDWSKLDELLKQHDSIITYNFLYDIGILHMLTSQHHINWSLRSHTLYDVLLLAKLENRNRFKYGLDDISQVFLKKKKTSNLLAEHAWVTELYQLEKYKETKRNVKKRPSDLVLEKWCKGHMNLFPQELVGAYCIQDVKLTWQLFEILYPVTNYVDLEMYSQLQQACIASKAAGVKIDLKRAREVYTDFTKARDEAKSRIYQKVGREFNIDSTTQLPIALTEQGYVLPKTKKGNASCGKDILNTLPGELIQDILEYRKANKMSRDFVRKAIDYQNAIPLQYRNEDVGVMFPTHRILGATTTGRFSSGGGTGCLELNVQQIPKKDEKFGAPCRELFIPFAGEQMGCLDFSGQEPRLQIHYASKLGCPGIQEIVKAYNENPKLDFHQKVADIANLPRSDAKAINLGLGYGMGAQKLYISLKLDDITTDSWIDKHGKRRKKLVSKKGEAILNQYHSMLPFMTDLHTKCKLALKNNKYIKTLGGRKLHLKPGKWVTDEETKKKKFITFEKDAVSGLVQGSAGDQTKKAIVMAWKLGYTFMIAVHDEVVFSSSKAQEVLNIWNDCMTNAFKLEVPVVVEGGIGKNWSTAKP